MQGVVGGNPRPTWKLALYGHKRDAPTCSSARNTCWCSHSEQEDDDLQEVNLGWTEIGDRFIEAITFGRRLAAWSHETGLCCAVRRWFWLSCNGLGCAVLCICTQWHIVYMQHLRYEWFKTMQACSTCSGTTRRFSRRLAISFCS